jgi:hypothetical protein
MMGDDRLDDKESVAEGAGASNSGTSATVSRVRNQQSFKRDTMKSINEVEGEDNESPSR